MCERKNKNLPQTEENHASTAETNNSLNLLQIGAENWNEDRILGDCMLEEVEIDAFHDLIYKKTRFKPQSAQKITSLDLIYEVTTPHIQIVFGGILSVSSGHWICTYYDGQGTIHIYDSLNRKKLDNLQITYLKRLYASCDPVVQFHEVQTQPDRTSCGVFCAAFATSVINNENPEDIVYDVNQMRPHMVEMIKSQMLTPFPVVSRCISKTYNTYTSTPSCDIVVTEVADKFECVNMEDTNETGPADYETKGSKEASQYTENRCYLNKDLASSKTHCNDENKISEVLKVSTSSKLDEKNDSAKIFSNFLPNDKNAIKSPRYYFPENLNLKSTSKSAPRTADIFLSSSPTLNNNNQSTRSHLIKNLNLTLMKGSKENQQDDKFHERKGEDDEEEKNVNGTDDMTSLVHENKPIKRHSTTRKKQSKNDSINMIIPHHSSTKLEKQFNLLSCNKNESGKILIPKSAQDKMSNRIDLFIDLISQPSRHKKYCKSRGEIKVKSMVTVHTKRKSITNVKHPCKQNVHCSLTTTAAAN